MITLLKDFPPYVAAYKASGTVDRIEYERIVMKKVDDVSQQFGALNFLVRLETGMENYSVAALVDYLKISFKHIHRWNRMAIVSDQKTVRRFYDALSTLVPGKIIGFELKDYEKAKAWVSEPFIKDENLFQTKLKAGFTAGMIGTSIMTLFSYVLSNLKQNNFKEPNLLGELMQSWQPNMKKSSSQALGWCEHYAIGVIWSLLYGVVRSQKHTTLSALFFGCISGATGIFMWKKMFELTPNPPKIEYKKYYSHLFFAHLIYTLGMHTTYRMKQPKLQA